MDSFMLGDRALEVLIYTGNKIPVVPDRGTVDNIHLATEGIRGFDFVIPLM
jgi:hypothetical protein